VRDGLTYRAAWVVAAAVGFWGLAIGLVALLVGGGVAIVTYAPDFALAGFVAFALAAALGFGLLPRISFKPQATGLPLATSEHARLRRLVDEVATQTGGRMPDALFVVHDANAFAGQHRARGLAKKHDIVGIGLPLLAVLTQKEVGAVLAHEMGHHVAGDVRLGPWVHRTRRAIARAVDRLEGSSFWFHLPFVAYAEFFMRTSLRISRAQEIQADAVAARVAGASAAASALRKTNVLSVAWDAYFDGEVAPLLNKGRVPPLLEGFERFWRAAQTPDTPAFRTLSATLEARRRPRQDDTHPSLAERIAALGDPPATADAVGSALDLLDDVSRAEDRVMRDLLRDPAMVLKPIAWEVIVDDVWLPGWREVVQDHAKALARLTPADLPAALARWEPLADATRRGPAILSPDAERLRLSRLLAIWLTVWLADRGFRIEGQPGLAVMAERGAERMEPHALVQAMMKSSANGAAEWRKRCEELGI
jgi:Zn-dependent protease with chaperone function